jgi:hypothetical protein
MTLNLDERNQIVIASAGNHGLDVQKEGKKQDWFV